MSKQITNISQLDLTKQYTVNDYMSWKFDEMVELIKGYIFRMSPAPSSRHQIISLSLSHEIYSFLKKKTCKLFVAPSDVFLQTKDVTDQTVVQPDIYVVCDPNKLDDKGCHGAPDFVIEILSNSTSKKDLNEKFHLYEEVGVKEYWIVYPYECVIDVFISINGIFKFDKKYTNNDEIFVKTLPGLKILMNDIFEN